MPVTGVTWGPEGVWFFGDGSDGDQVITTPNTVFTKDMYLRNLTITAPGYLQPSGYRVHVQERLVIGVGASIRQDGDPGFAATGGTAEPTGSFLGSHAGGNGTTTAGAAGSGQATGQFTAWAGGGGAGGLGSAGAGGAGGGFPTPSPNEGAGRAILTALTGMKIAASSHRVDGIVGGPGGGGGGGDNTNAGGGGGAGGGNVFICAREIVLLGSITVEGGDGAAATTGNAGGGGGGGGGGIFLVYERFTGNGTLLCGGGLGGAKSGTGIAGSDGSNGIVVRHRVFPVR